MSTSLKPVQRKHKPYVCALALLTPCSCLCVTVSWRLLLLRCVSLFQKVGLGGLRLISAAPHCCVAAVAGGGGDAARNRRKRGGGERLNEQATSTWIHWKRLHLLHSRDPRKSSVSLCYSAFDCVVVESLTAVNDFIT